MVNVRNLIDDSLDTPNLRNELRTNIHILDNRKFSIENDSERGSPIISESVIQNYVKKRKSMINNLDSEEFTHSIETPLENDVVFEEGNEDSAI